MATPTKLTASELYNELVENFKIKEKIGSVEIKLGNITAKYNGKDAIGDLLQEWLGEWMKSKNYYFRTKVDKPVKLGHLSRMKVSRVKQVFKIDSFSSIS